MAKFQTRQSSKEWHEGLSLNPEAIILGSLPTLNHENAYSTTGNALHPLHYTGTLVFWDEFELQIQVWSKRLGPLFETTKRTPCAWVDIDNQFADTKELLLCGNEDSVSARFFESCLKKVSVVALNLAAVQPDLQLGVQFGDWRVAGSGSRGAEKKIPDCTARSRNSDIKSKINPSPLIAGEMKTPWKHKLGRALERRETGAEFRQMLGQIADYLKTFGLTYGFLSTYDETIFVKMRVRNKARELFAMLTLVAMAQKEGNVQLEAPDKTLDTYNWVVTETVVLPFRGQSSIGKNNKINYQLKMKDGLLNYLRAKLKPGQYGQEFGFEKLASTTPPSSSRPSSEASDNPPSPPPPNNGGGSGGPGPSSSNPPRSGHNMSLRSGPGKGSSSATTLPPPTTTARSTTLSPPEGRGSDQPPRGRSDQDQQMLAIRTKKSVSPAATQGAQGPRGGSMNPSQPMPPAGPAGPAPGRSEDREKPPAQPGAQGPRGGSTAPCQPMPPAGPAGPTPGRSDDRGQAPAQPGAQESGKKSSFKKKLGILSSSSYSDPRAKKDKNDKKDGK